MSYAARDDVRAWLRDNGYESLEHLSDDAILAALDRPLPDPVMARRRAEAIEIAAHLLIEREAKARHEAITKLLQRVSAVDQAKRRFSAEEFRELFAMGRALTSATDAELANSFGTSRPTIDRWIRGVTCPAPAGRRHYLRKLLRHLGDR